MTSGQSKRGKSDKNWRLVAGLSERMEDLLTSDK